MRTSCALVLRALLAGGVMVAAATLSACARGRVDETTTDVPISGRSMRIDPEPVLDGAVDEDGGPIKPTPDVPRAPVDAGPATRDTGVPARDAGAAPACGAWQQACCGVSACGPGLTCGSGSCAATATCGASGQACCTGVAAVCVARQACASGTCRPCGAVGQVCCTAVAPACNTGLRCAMGACVAG